VKEVSEMTTDTLAEAVLHEAEAIVYAEWMRLQHDSASREDALTGPRAEMPAARRRPPRVATLTATLRRPAMTPYGHRDGWPARRWPGLPVWATQRSPPQHSGVLPKRVVEHRR
jgi:hypothetical protein